MKKILFHLVSGQNLPNLIAAKIINPDENLFLCTNQSIRQFEVFKRIFPNSKSLIIDAWDYDKIKFQIKDFLDNHSNDETILNFTGGTKIMSLAAFELFKEQKKECYYINTENNEYINFKGDGNTINKFPIEVKLTISEILDINNQQFELGQSELNTSYNQLKEIISKNYKIQTKLLSVASEFQKNKEVYEKKITEGNLKGSQIIFKNKKSYIKLILNNNELITLEEEGRNLLEFIFGKWFEYDCLDSLIKLNFFDEIRPHINIIRKTAKKGDKLIDKNEIDIFGIKGIYTYIFECKAGNIKAEAVDKLVAIKETYVGRYSSLIFITKFPLDINNTAHKNVLEKIKDNNIIHFTFNQLSDKNFIFKELEKRDNIK